MSVEAMAIVLHHAKAKGTALNVLLGIANHEGDGGAWPGVETLAKYGRCSVRRVQQILRQLETTGEIEIDYQAGGLHDMNDHLRPNRYRILVRCPADCDRTAQHRVVSRDEAAKRKVPRQRGGETGFTGGVQPASPGGGETGFTLTVLEEPPIEPPTGKERDCSTSARFARVGGDDSKRSSNDDDLLPSVGIDPGAEDREFSDWRSEDRAAFKAVIGDRLATRGTKWTVKDKNAQYPMIFDADVWYNVLRRQAKPIKWPGKFFNEMYARGADEAVEDWLIDEGLEKAQ